MRRGSLLKKPPAIERAVTPICQAVTGAPSKQTPSTTPKGTAPGESTSLLARARSTIGTTATRLVKVTEHASVADSDLEQNSLQTVEQTSDAFHQWISRTVDSNGDQGTTPVEPTFFLYDQ